MRVRDGVLGHVVLNVAKLKKSENFYRSIVGMKVSARNRRTKMTFMSFGREHHDVALMELPKGENLKRGVGGTAEIGRLRQLLFSRALSRLLVIHVGRNEADFLS